MYATVLSWLGAPRAQGGSETWEWMGVSQIRKINNNNILQRYVHHPFSLFEKPFVSFNIALSLSTVSYCNTVCGFEILIAPHNAPARLSCVRRQEYMLLKSLLQSFPRPIMSFPDAISLDTVAASATASNNAGPLAFLSSLPTNPPVVGVAWLVSSAVFTTYSTTKFLKYSYDGKTDLKEKLHRIELPAQHPLSRFFSLPPPTMLTLYRFAGSLLLGLTFHPPDFAILERIRSTIAAVSDFALPAAFLFIANLANS